MSDVSCDIESMGTSPGSAINGLGACEFDANTGEIGRTFYRAINLATAVREGLTLDAGTVMWWMGQSEEARNAIRFNTYDIRQVLTEFSEWLAPIGHNDVRPWLRGPSFDGSLLTAAYKACGIPVPWRYWNERCHRTLTARNPSVEEPERDGTYHNALDDSIHQAKWLIKIAEAQRARK